MWIHYQQAIIKYIFIPYLVYLASLSILGGFFCGQLIMIQYEEDIDSPELQAEKAYLIRRAYPLVSLATSLMLCFGSLELSSMLSEGL
jgi:hypothetical protein